MTQLRSADEGRHGTVFSETNTTYEAWVCDLVPPDNRFRPSQERIKGSLPPELGRLAPHFDRIREEAEYAAADIPFEIVDERPYEDGKALGAEIGSAGFEQRIGELLNSPVIKGSLGMLTRAEITAMVMERMDTPPEDKYPELKILRPETVALYNGLADGAGCNLATVVLAEYLSYRSQIDSFSQSVQYHPDRPPLKDDGCSGVLRVGLAGSIGGQNCDSLPLSEKPNGFQHWNLGTPSPRFNYEAQRQLHQWRRPPSGFGSYGPVNGAGLARVCSVSNSVLCDEPIRDVFPDHTLIVERFAANIPEAERLFRLYKEHIWGRYSQIWADAYGRAMVVEKSTRDVGIRYPENGVLFCTEGHWETEMGDYNRERRKMFATQAGMKFGDPHFQYPNDCAVRFHQLGELLHNPQYDGGYHDIFRALTYHGPEPRDTCRHAGPNAPEYDTTITLNSRIVDVLRRIDYLRAWDPWKKFSCQKEAAVVRYPFYHP